MTLRWNAYLDLYPVLTRLPPQSGQISEFLVATGAAELTASRPAQIRESKVAVQHRRRRGQRWCLAFYATHGMIYSLESARLDSNKRHRKCGIRV